MAACFGCLSPALTIAAALSGRSVFITGPDQSQSPAARKKLTSPGDLIGLFQLFPIQSVHVVLFISV